METIIEAIPIKPTRIDLSLLSINIACDTADYMLTYSDLTGEVLIGTIYCVNGFVANNAFIKNPNFTGTIIVPAQVVAITKWDFRQRMTDEEKVAIGSYGIVIDNQAIDDATKLQRKMIMKSIMDDYDAATMITLTDPIMTKFATVIAGCEIISAVRIAEILAIK